MSGAIVVCDEIKAMLEQAYQAGWMSPVKVTMGNTQATHMKNLSG